MHVETSGALPAEEAGDGAASSVTLECERAKLPPLGGVVGPHSRVASPAYLTAPQAF